MSTDPKPFLQTCREEPVVQDRNEYRLHDSIRSHRKNYTPEAPQRRIAPARDWLKIGLIVACIGIGGALTAPKAHAWTDSDRRVSTLRILASQQSITEETLRLATQALKETVDVKS